MKIGIDCRTILNPGVSEGAGVGHYTYYLVKNLLEIDQENKYVLFFDSRFKKVEEFKKHRNVTIKFFPFYQYKKYLPLAYSQMLISAILSQENLDVFHSPANTLPLPYNKKSIVTVHDLAIYQYPDFFPTQFLNRQVFSTKVLVPKSLTKAAKIIAVSKNTKTDIIEEFGIPEDKIEVVYEGVNISDKGCVTVAGVKTVETKYGIRGKYILYLGTIEPRKNIVSLIRAFRNLQLVYDSPVRQYQLVLAGARGWKDKAVYDAIADANASILGQKRRRSGKERRTGHESRSVGKQQRQGERRQNIDRRADQPIKYIGYVSHQDKLSLICQATCFVFPSLYEGFGLPVLEAMSLGTPVITSNLSSLPEIVGENGGILINPNKESEIADAISQVLTDEGLRESLSVAGSQRAKEFSWEKCARETLEVYQLIK